jgi:hypothetical protein
MTKNTQPPHEINPAAAENTVPADTEIISTLRAEIDGLQSELRLIAAREDLVSKLETAGARSPQLLFASVRDKLQFGGDHALENGEALVAMLKHDLPEQFGMHTPAASIDGGSGATANARPLTKEALAKMSPEQISRLDWATVRQVLSQS